MHGRTSRCLGAHEAKASIVEKAAALAVATLVKLCLAKCYADQLYARPFVQPRFAAIASCWNRRWSRNTASSTPAFLNAQHRPFASAETPSFAFACCSSARSSTKVEGRGQGRKAGQRKQTQLAFASFSKDFHMSIQRSKQVCMIAFALS